MLVAIEWCLKNKNKAYKIHAFNGTFNQFVAVLVLAQNQGIEFTRDIPDELIDSVLSGNEKTGDLH